MTTQQKYGIVALFMLLNIIALFFIFTGRDTPPVQHAAVQQPVSTSPAVQQPAPTQQTPIQDLRQEQLRKCDERAVWYLNEFTTEWPQKVRESRNSEAAERVQNAFFDAQLKWRVEVGNCRGIGWNPPAAFTAEVVDRAIKEDCDWRGTNYGYAFQTLSAATPDKVKEFFAQEYYVKYNVRSGKALADWYSQLKKKCTDKIIGGWTPPFDEQIIAKIIHK